RRLPSPAPLDPNACRLSPTRLEADGRSQLQDQPPLTPVHLPPGIVRQLTRLVLQTSIDLDCLLETLAVPDSGRLLLRYVGSPPPVRTVGRSGQTRHLAERITYWPL